jgi:hypothetical protein
MAIGNRGLLALSVALVAAALQYRAVARRDMVIRAETELAAEGLGVRNLIEAGKFRRSYELNAAFERIRRESALEILSIQMRDPDGVVVAGAGGAAEAAIPLTFVQSHSQSRKPMFKVRERLTGTLIVEALPVAWRDAGTGPSKKRWLLECANASNDRIGTVEIVARLRPGLALPSVPSHKPLYTGTLRLS